MKFSYEWMRDMVPDLAIPPAELEHLITMKTAECEGIERWGAHFEHVIAVVFFLWTHWPRARISGW